MKTLIKSDLQDKHIEMNGSLDLIFIGQQGQALHVRFSTFRLFKIIEKQIKQSENMIEATLLPKK